MSSPELSESNFKRISIVNWILSVPLLLLFAWPYLYAARLLEIETLVSLAGALFFGLPFMITILHGHATMALGPAHRHHYYDWLRDHPLTYGLFFHPAFMRTRFRLILLGISLVWLGIGFFL